MNSPTMAGACRFRFLASSLLLALASAGCGGQGGGGGAAPAPLQAAGATPAREEDPETAAVAAPIDPTLSDPAVSEPVSEAPPASDPVPQAPPPADPAPEPPPPPPPPPPPANPPPTNPPAPEAPLPPWRDAPAAQLVLGQPHFTGSRPNQDGPAGLNTLYMPRGVSAAGPQGQLVVSDYENNRLLFFPALPGSNGAAAAFELPAAGPIHTFVKGEQLLVVENKGHRVSIYQRFPVDGSARPDVIVGQAGPDGDQPGISAGSLFTPYSATVTPQGQLIVADAGNHRVLIWRALPQRHGQPADLVLGQSATSGKVWKNDDSQLMRSDPHPTARTLSYPTGVWSDGQRLVVNDTQNNRLLIWASMPQASFQPADIVLGRGGFEPGAVMDNDGDGWPDIGLTGAAFAQPYGTVDSDGTRLALADSYNHRVLIWNSFPQRHGQPADRVIGQAGMTTARRNAAPFDSQGRANEWGLNTPTGVQLLPDGRVLVSDTYNHRVLVFGPP